MAREIGDILEVLPYPALLVKPAVAAAPDYLARPLRCAESVEMCIGGWVKGRERQASR
jgi:hypothetical protein